MDDLICESSKAHLQYLIPDLASSNLCWLLSAPETAARARFIQARAHLTKIALEGAILRLWLAGQLGGCVVPGQRQRVATVHVVGQGLMGHLLAVCGAPAGALLGNCKDLQIAQLVCLGILNCAIHCSSAKALGNHLMGSVGMLQLASKQMGLPPSTRRPVLPAAHELDPHSVCCSSQGTSDYPQSAVLQGSCLQERHRASVWMTAYCRKTG